MDSAAEFFKLIPSFAGSDSISHALPLLQRPVSGVGIALVDFLPQEVLEEGQAAGSSNILVLRSW